MAAGDSPAWAQPNRKPLNPGIDSRRQAIFVLARWLATRDFPDRLLPAGPDHGFVMDLVYTTVRQWRLLEWALSRFLRRPPAVETRAALLLGACQLLTLEGIAEHAALHATVEASKIGAPRDAGFVNAVLRNLLRQRETLRAEEVRQPLAVRFSHPDELAARWLARYGAGETEALFRLDNQPAETVLACLPGRVTRDDLLRRCTAGGLAVVPHAADPDCLILHHGNRVEQVPGYAEGAFVPQDPATLAAVRLLDVSPGQRVLDACAAPGGKAAQIAARLGPGGGGELVAMDRHADRLRTLRLNLDRLGLRPVVLVQGDAGDGAALPVGTFDRILLDAPCTNTGVLRRRPDARWRFSEAHLRKQTAQQLRLLLALLPRLAPGGRLVYSTCSLEPEENALLVAHVLAQLDGFEQIDSLARLPTRDGTDGAFAALLAHRGSHVTTCVG